VNPDTVLSLGRDASLIMLYVAGPVLAAGLVTGVIVSVFQAVTQVQEASLSFVPKLAAILLVFAFMGHWMLAQLVTYTVTLYSNLDAWSR
jgi:flagellar biosynthetic protein FliQ